MSACPYGILAENELLGSALPMLGDTFDLQIHFITFSRFAGANGTAVPSGYCASPKALGGKGAPPLGPTDDAPCSMHGSDEADEDARQMAVEELYSPAKLNAYILAFNKLGCTLDKYRDCSAKVSKYKSVGVDFAKISSHAAKSLSAYAASTQKAAAEVGYKAIRSTELSSPTLVVNGHVAALGALDAAGFVSRVCAFYAPGSLPEACAPDKQKEIRAGGKADRAEAPAAPAGASCLRADALPAAVPTPRLALAHAAGAGPSAALLPAAAGLLATAAAVFALVAVSLKRMRRYGHVGAPALAAAHGRQTVSTPLV
ncbi:hypothetical protein T492DRAFT_931489 [Pavlovales sp. CCMP2436]|nr:hypothetical protein T492DRAFT_931489 [Pavlovales sp. CCMP2436]